MTRSDPEIYKHKLCSLLKRHIYDIIFREINDERIKNVSIKHLELNKDSTIAYVYVETFSLDLDRKKLVEALNNAAPFIFNRIRKELRIKNIPDIVFRYDDSTDYYFKINGLLKGIKDDEKDKKDEK